MRPSIVTSVIIWMTIFYDNIQDFNDHCDHLNVWHLCSTLFLDCLILFDCCKRMQKGPVWIMWTALEPHQTPGSEEALISFPMETFIPLLAEASVQTLIAQARMMGRSPQHVLDWFMIDEILWADCREYWNIFELGNVLNMLQTLY